MLKNLKEIMQTAVNNNNAIGCFNTPNLESLMAVLQAAEAQNVPVIISHAELHEPIMPLDVIGPIMVDMAKKSKVPVCVHLDHGECLDYLHRSLEIGFTSIMYDGSTLPFEENITNTKKAVQMAQKYSASVEAELGTIGGREEGDGKQDDTSNMYTNPQQAKQFVEETKIDALACSFGTAHGFYTQKPVLDINRIKEISQLTKLPLVMHGGSGVSPEDYKKSIQNGIRKINYYSYMSLAGVKGVQSFLESTNVQYFHDIAFEAVKSMEEDVLKAIDLFYK